MDNLLLDVATRASRYLREMDQRSVAPAPEALKNLAELDEPLPAGPTSTGRVLEMLDRLGSPATAVTAGRRFYGFVHGGSLPAALAANWLAGAWDQNAGLWISSPIGAALGKSPRAGSSTYSGSPRSAVAAS
jgi:glutamate/tyrosine decarboxylase-like PLP-dependent enzyme